MPDLALAARRVACWPFGYSCNPLEDVAVLFANDEAAKYLHESLGCSSPQLLLYLNETRSFDNNEILASYSWGKGLSPLVAAASGGSITTLEYLFTSHPLLFIDDLANSFAMRIALRNRNKDFVLFCFQHNFVANTAILAIVQNLPELSERISNNPREISNPFHGSTPLYWAVIYDSPESIQILLKNGASFDELGPFTLQELAGYSGAQGVLDMYPEPEEQP